MNSLLRNKIQIIPTGKLYIFVLPLIRDNGTTAYLIMKRKDVVILKVSMAFL